eukprot:TRINITY_DN5794_c1_g2_i2.p1 TRINITY_DN5794_c1_g2~~TRINITY_DN5794_c1_g2_i2.p1  ORF type:complete len:337 (+),score=75.32 TRINITY_DN5794_c1_g2_i2:109-1011(+)
MMVATSILSTAITIGVMSSYKEFSPYQPNYSVDWITELEDQMREQAVRTKPIQSRGEMQMAWQTPIYRVNLASIFVDVPSFNAKLAAAIITEYRTLQEKNPQLTKSADLKGANQAFYDWQMAGGWGSFENLPEMKRLTDIFQHSTDTFLRSIGLDENFIKRRDRTMVSWATVHESCISHPPHSHPHEIVSGVYYVKMPASAGPITFEDPRGPLPPFDNRITIDPVEGDLILFPSWLIHSVMPTEGKSERISIPFNIHGSWESTTGISTQFPVPLQIPDALRNQLLNEKKKQASAGKKQKQ